jgi:hypothetical protein
MIALLALRNLVLKPWRSAFLLFGYCLGVAVMIVLLSIERRCCRSRATRSWLAAARSRFS